MLEEFGTSMSVPGLESVSVVCSHMVSARLLYALRAVSPAPFRGAE
jgi:hypothetical protein